MTPSTSPSRRRPATIAILSLSAALSALLGGCFFGTEDPVAPAGRSVRPLARLADTVIVADTSYDTTLSAADTTARIAATVLRMRVASLTASDEVTLSRGGRDSVFVERAFRQDTAWDSSRADSTVKLLALLGELGSVEDTVTSKRLLGTADTADGALRIRAVRYAYASVVRRVTLVRAVFPKAGWDGVVPDTMVFHRPDSVLSATRRVAEERDTARLGGSFVFAATSDYATGSYATIGLDGTLLGDGIAPIHSDAVARYRGGDDILVLNRLGRDNVQAIDRRSLRTVLQFALPAGFNPYDAAVLGDSLILAGYGSNRLRVHDRRDGSPLGEIDLSRYADTTGGADALAEPTQLALAGGSLYVLLQNLDEKHGWTPLQARLLRLGPAGEARSAFDLPIGNPQGMAWDSAGAHCFIACAGKLFRSDYSVEPDGALLDCGAGAGPADTVLTEAKAGGNLGKPVWFRDKVYVIVTRDAGDALLAVDPENGSFTELAGGGAYQFADLAVDPAGSALYLADRGAGLRLFDLAAGKEKAGSPVKLLLPPNSLAVVR